MPSDDPKNSQPCVGIFWVAQAKDGAPRLIAVGCPLEQAEAYGDCLTYGPGHYETWTRWRRDRTIDAGHRAIVRSCEYEDWPRGRIVFDQSKDRFVLYADRKLMLPGTIARIQRQFAISAGQTTVETDLHYKSNETPGAAKLSARLLAILDATYKIDYLSDPCAARTIEAGSIAWIVVFAVVRSETVPLGRRRCMPQIYVKPTFDEEQIVIMNDAHRPPGHVPMFVLECPKSCVQFCGCRARNLGSKDIHVSKQITRFTKKLRCFLGGFCLLP